MPLYRYLSDKLALVGVNTSSAVGAIQGAELLWQAGAIVPEDNRQMILEAVRGDRSTLPDDLLLRVADALNLLLAARGVVHPPIDYYDLVQAQNNHSPNHSGQGCEVH